MKNRITIAPLYLGYAGKGGTVSDILLEHYWLMAISGVAMGVVKNRQWTIPSGAVPTEPYGPTLTATLTD